MLLLERPWTRQPFSGRVNLGCPLVEGLAFLVNGADPTLRDLVSGIIPTLSSASAAINTSSTCLGLNRSTSGGWHNYGRTRADEIAVGSVLFIAHDVERVSFFGSGENSLGNGFEIALDNSAYGTNSFYLSGNNAFIADAGFNALESWQRPQVAFFTWDGVNTIAYSRGRVAKTTSTAYVAALNTNRITRLATRIASSTADSLTKMTLIAAWNRPLRPAEIRALTENPWQLFEPRRIWVPVSAGGTNTYTFSVSGGATFSGTSPLVKERVQTPGGGIAFAGAPVISHERAIAASGQVTFSGTAPIVSTASYQFDVSGGVTFSGSPDVIKEKILPAAGGVNFGGSARLIFVPVGGTGTNDSDRISVGVSRKVGVS